MASSRIWRLPGHELAGEGAAYSPDGRRINHRTVSGVGCAKCACGEMSEELPSGQARRRWHREHKQGIITAPTRRAVRAGESPPSAGATG